MSKTDPASLSFARDIRPMFTDTDVEHMQAFGIDLSDKDDVETHADAIYQQVSAHTMPPPGAGEQWTDEMCDRFKAWQTQGCPA